MDLRSPVVAILVGGAPAPGINSVINSVTIEALNSQCTVIGFYDGFKHMKLGRSMLTPLQWENVTSIFSKGGSILRTSNEQLKTATDVDNALRVLEFHRVRYLITIGGSQTAYSASLLATAAQSTKLEIGVCHVPKTIFNDLPLPPDTRCFGYSTACDAGVALLNNFADDARSTLRWFIVVAMGQRAGHLALGIGKAAAATLTLIPEQFIGRTMTFYELVSIIEGAIYKRKAMNKEYGTVVIAEGLVYCLEKNDMIARFGSAEAAHGLLGRYISLELNERFTKQGLQMPVVPRNVGYELRSVDPNSADIILTRDLGYGAMRFVLEGGTNAIITLKNEALYPISLSELLDKKTNSTLIKTVDITSLGYQVALGYMIMLRVVDLQNITFLNKMAAAANMSPQQFVERFQSVALPPVQLIVKKAQEHQLPINSHSPSGSYFDPLSGHVNEPFTPKLDVVSQDVIGSYQHA